MDDVIRKQAAIEALGEEPEVWSGNDEYAQGLNNQWHYDVNALKAVPSVQPEPCKDAVSKAKVLETYADLYDVFDDNKGIQNELHKVFDRINNLPPAEPEQRWIPCSEKLPEEDHWLGGSGRQFSDKVQVSVVNYDDEDEWVDVSYTIDGEWALELPRHCKILAWMSLPEPYKAERREE